MARNINFDGKTKLKDWWGIVKDNFIYLENFITQVNDSIDTKIAEAQGINPTKHIAENADDTSGWIITDRYLVPVPSADGKVVYSEYAYIDGAWVVVGSTQEADLSGYYDKAEVDTLMSGKTEIVCGKYNKLNYAEYTEDGITFKEAFVNLGFTPDRVEVMPGNGMIYNPPASGSSYWYYYGGIAHKNSPFYASLSGTSSYKLVEIVEGGFMVRYFATNYGSADALGITGTRVFKAYKHCTLITITGDGQDNGADNVITKEEA